MAVSSGAAFLFFRNGIADLVSGMLADKIMHLEVDLFDQEFRAESLIETNI